MKIQIDMDGDFMKSILKIFMSILYLILAIFLFAMCIYVKDYLTIRDRSILIVLSFVNFVVALCISVAVDYNLSFYECPNCEKIFKPSLFSYLFSTHTPLKRHLKCPKCKEKSMCRVRYNDKKEKKKDE